MSVTVPLPWQPTARLRALATLAVFAVVLSLLAHTVAALVLGLPELVWIAWFGHRRLQHAVTLKVEWTRGISRQDEPVDLLVSVGDGPGPGSDGPRTEATWAVRAAGPHLDRTVLRAPRRPGARSEDVTDAETKTTAIDRETHAWTLRTHIRTWGRVRPGRWMLAAVGPGDLWTARLTGRLPLLDVVPNPVGWPTTAQSQIVRPWPGNRPSRWSGAGGEPDGATPYRPGSDLRRINWRVSQRRDDLYVTTFAAERAQDVIIVVDALVDGEPGLTSSRARGGGSRQVPTLDRAVRAAAGIAHTHLRAGDRVGILVVSPGIAWVPPAGGRRHLLRLEQTLLHARDHDSVVPPDLTRVPHSVIPQGAAVVMLSPLLSETSITMIGDLRRRGLPLLVVEIDPGRPLTRRGRTDDLTSRLWELVRAGTRADLRQHGVAVLPWPATDGLTPPDSALVRGLSRPGLVVGSSLDRSRATRNPPSENGPGSSRASQPLLGPVDASLGWLTPTSGRAALLRAGAVLASAGATWLLTGSFGGAAQWAAVLGSITVAGLGVMGLDVAVTACGLVLLVGAVAVDAAVPNDSRTVVVSWLVFAVVMGSTSRRFPRNHTSSRAGSDGRWVAAASAAIASPVLLMASVRALPRTVSMTLATAPGSWRVSTLLAGLAGALAVAVFVLAVPARPPTTDRSHARPRNAGEAESHDFHRVVH
jgi:uncharacterized protein (DUF58 family)